jgi:hypothetical protein
MGALLKDNKESTLITEGYHREHCHPEKMFSSVELVTTKRYPYPTNYHHASGCDEHLILRGPVHQEIEFPCQEKTM